MNFQFSKFKLLGPAVLVFAFCYLPTQMRDPAAAGQFAIVANAQSPTPKKETEKINPPANQILPSGINLTLSPTYISLSTDPGKDVSSQFKVTNNNAFPEYLELRLVKFQADKNGRSPVIADIEKEDEFAKWIEYNPSRFILNPNETKSIKFTISPPKSASLGYYYGFLVGRIAPGAEEGKSQAVIAASAGITVLLYVKSPNAQRELQIVDFKTDKLFYENLPANFELIVRNSGNVHVIPFGNIFIDSLFNKEVAVLEANPGFGNILPQTERRFDVIWNDGFVVRVPKEENGGVVKNKNGKEIMTTKYDFTKANKFRIGRYSANLLLVYDNGERDIPLEAQVSFWVVPWKILGVGLIIVLLTLLGLRSILAPVWRKTRSTGR